MLAPESEFSLHLSSQLSHPNFQQTKITIEDLGAICDALCVNETLESLNLAV